ncbi:MAG: hypothetical protein AAFY76_01970 [Cyanobacteria bacterium J06649_11]
MRNAFMSNKINTLLLSGVITALFVLASSSAQAWTLRQLGDIFRKEGDEAGTNSGFCMITPNPEKGLFIEEEPLFIWRGRVNKIEVFHLTEYERPLWQKSDELFNRQQIHYQGPPLEKGRGYHVRINESSERYYFEILSEEHEDFEFLQSIQDGVRSANLGDLVSGHDTLKQLDDDKEWFTVLATTIFDLDQYGEDDKAVLRDAFCNPN